jgi:hypothetical protein
VLIKIGSLVENVRHAHDVLVNEWWHFPPCERKGGNNTYSVDALDANNKK